MATPSKSPAFRVPVSDVRHAYRKALAAAKAAGYDAEKEGFRREHADLMLECPIFQQCTAAAVRNRDKSHAIQVVGALPWDWSLGLQCWPSDVDEADKAEQAAATAAFAATKKAALQATYEAKEAELQQEAAETRAANANGSAAAALPLYEPFPTAVWMKKPTEDERNAALDKYLQATGSKKTYVEDARELTRRKLRKMDMLPVLVSTQALNHGAYGTKPGAQGWHYAATPDMEERGFMNPRTQPDYQAFHVRLVTARGSVNDYRLNAVLPLLPPQRKGIATDGDITHLKYLLSVIVSGFNRLYIEPANAPDKFEEHAALVFPVVLASLVKEGYRAALADPESAESAAAHMNMWLTVFPQAVLSLQGYMDKLPRIGAALREDLLEFLRNPARSHKRWPSLTEALCAAYLCGLPWNLVRRAAWRRLLADMAFASAIVSKTGSDASVENERNTDHKRLMHAFHQTLGEWQRVLMLGGLVWKQSFREAYDALKASEGAYTQEERRAFAQQLSSIRAMNRDDMTDAMQLLGLGTGDMAPRELKQLALKLFSQTREALGVGDGDKPSGGLLAGPPEPPAAKRARALQVLSAMMRNEAVLEDSHERTFTREARESQLAAQKEALRKQHEGFPLLPKGSALCDASTCGYCFKEFPSRDALFVHLRHAGVDTVSSTHVQALEARRCVICNITFPSVEALHAHYDSEESRCYRGQAHEVSPAEQKRLTAEQQQDTAGVETKEDETPQRPVQDNDVECCVCLDAAPSVVFLPCTHQVTCKTCFDTLSSSGSMAAKCPACRGAIQASYVVVM